MKKMFRLAHAQARELASDYCQEAPEFTIVTFCDASKTREQEIKYHAMIGDIEKQCTFCDMKLEFEDWKRLMLDAFARVKASLNEPLAGGTGRIIPNLDHSGFVQLGVQSRDLKVKEASDFIEYLYSFGATYENSMGELKPVKWKDEQPH